MTLHYATLMMDLVARYPASYTDVLVFPDTAEFSKLLPHDMPALGTCAHCYGQMDLPPKEPKSKN